jgi:uncharacterized protein
MTASGAAYPLLQATGPAVQARLLSDPVAFSPRYDLDRNHGRFSRAGHPLRGEPLAGRVLAAPGVQGGVAGGWSFLAMAGSGVGPVGLIFKDVNPVMVQGAVTAGIPVVAGVAEAFFTEAKTNDLVLIDPDAKVVRLL